MSAESPIVDHRDRPRPVLRVEHLTTHFVGEGRRRVRAVDDVSFEIHRGETFALLGESGCGKSMTSLSLMRLLPGNGRIVSGDVWLDGENLSLLPEAEMRRLRGRRMAMIFQEPMTSLNPVLTVGEQIAEVVRLHRGLRGGGVESAVLELLEAVGIPEPRARYREYPHQLSGGMKQRVMIAIALAGEPDLLIADEPTTALDVTIQAQVLDLLRRLQSESGMALLLITHDLGVVAEMADRVAVMYAGQLIEEAARDPFFAHPRHPYSRKLFESLPSIDKRERPLSTIVGHVPSLTSDFGGCRFADRCDQSWSLCHEAVPGWFETVAGQRARCHLLAPGLGQGASAPPPTDHRAREGEGPSSGRAVPSSVDDRPLLEVEGLEVHFPIRKGLLQRTVGHVHAVDGVDLRLGRGRTLALVGESGCGKTTIGKAILQLVRPTRGTIRFAGDDLSRLRGDALRRRRKDFQIVFQDPFSSMNPRMRVGEIIAEGMQALEIVTERREREAEVASLLDRVGLPADAARRYPHEFSGGQRQRICIARALAVSPKLLVCDEPTSALDISVQAQILNLLKSLQDETGLSYLFITHNLSVVAYLADEVAVMYLGRIVERGPVTAILGSARHPYTRALLSAIPVVDADSGREVVRLEGDLPSPIEPPSGCHFHTRCPDAMPCCRERYPDPIAWADGHEVRCHLYTDAAGGRAT